MSKQRPRRSKPGSSGRGVILDGVLITFVPAGQPSSTESRCLRAGKHDASKRPTRRPSWTDSGRRSARWALNHNGHRKPVIKNIILRSLNEIRLVFQIIEKRKKMEADG